MIKRYNGYTSRFRKPGSGGAKSFSFSFLKPVRNILNELNFKFRIPKYVIVGFLCGFLIAYIVILISDIQKHRDLATYQPNVTTKIFDKDGILISELFTQKRDVVTLKKIPKDLINAFISIEDSEFYSHFGLNVKGIVRAFFVNIFSARIRQGGSTITQQLAKVLLTSRERNIFRKIKEASIAIFMEMFYTKEEILEMYFNQIFLGHGVYGVESASRFYFDKHVWELNLAECAVLASLPSSPNNLSPIRYPERAISRHRIVLARMVDMGFISIKEAEKCYLAFWPDYLSYINELSPTSTTWSKRIDKAPWFTEHVRRTLVAKYGEDMVYQKGLKVYTTLDVGMQEAAQRLLQDALERQTDVSNSLFFQNEDYIIENYSDLVEILSFLYNVYPSYKKGSLEIKKFNDRVQERVVDEFEGLNYIVGLSNIGGALEQYKEKYCELKNFQNVEGCLVSIDHRNGYIKAMVGGSEFTSTNQLNRVMQSKRQPGSAVKPLIYTAAMESGKYSPATTILDSPVVFMDNEGTDWIPENYEGEYYGQVSLRKALAKSINVISIKLVDGLGIGTVLDYCGKLLKLDDGEVKSRIPRNYSIALGSFDVSPFELARAYGIIANGGKDVIPYSIRYVEDRNGGVLENNEEKINRILEEETKSGDIQIIEPATAQIMIDMMKSVITSGTGMGASPGRPAAGKTGTTNTWRDGWFVGFVPQLTTCVWMGYDKLGLSLGMGQSGGVVAAPVWGEYMRAALAGDEIVDFPEYAKLTEREVCAVSGMLPSFYCRRTVKEVFTEKMVNEDKCDQCKDLEYDDIVLRKGPNKNIVEDQKEDIMGIFNRKKGEGGSVLNDVGNDFLE